MPFRSGVSRITLNGSTFYNQAAPILLSNKGRFVASDMPFDFEIHDGWLRIEGEGALELKVEGDTLRSARRAWVAQNYPLPSQIPPEILFRQPQYCTWMAMGYRQEQTGILEYARELIRRGYSPGTFIIDDTWQEDYGNWNFHPGRFPDPRAMVDELKSLGFTVMLWIAPYLSADSLVARQLHRRGLLIRNSAGDPALVHWWNGASTALDLSHPEAISWLCSRLDHLIEKYGVVGFKFDGGDADAYSPAWNTHSPTTPNEMTELYNRLGMRYPFNEFRACWKCNGFPLNQRLCDKDHSWEGLKSIFSDTLTANLLGYHFGAPDMVAGGQYNNIEEGFDFNSELFIRSTQLAALMSMIQFSLAPWRIISSQDEGIVLDMLRQRAMLTDYIVAEARYSAHSGEPLIRSMEYSYPQEDWSAYPWQFLHGGDLLVAPVIEAGARTKKVKLPPGIWQTPDDGREYIGPSEIEISAPLSRLPYFLRSNP